MNNQSFHFRLLFAICILLFGISIAKAQTLDTEYHNKIVEYTTDSAFLPSSVTTITKQPGIPSPLDHFGAIIGAPGQMHLTYEIYDYLQELADASPKLFMEQIGTSEEGRPINLVTISNANTIRNIDKYSDILVKLADPRKISEQEAKKLIDDGKVVYYLNGGMHSTEMGSPEMLMELAYRLITDESEETKHILENCIILMNPVSEPDGRDKQVDWYYRYTKDRKEYDDGFPKSPPYWGKYVFHDNNRDGLQITQAITNGLFTAFFKWHPTIMLDLHESVPLLYISPAPGPTTKMWIRLQSANGKPLPTAKWHHLLHRDCPEFFTGHFTMAGGRVMAFGLQTTTIQSDGFTRPLEMLAEIPICVIFQKPVSPATL